MEDFLGVYGSGVDPLITFDPSLYANAPYLQASGTPNGGAGIGNTPSFSASAPAVDTGGMSWSAFIQGIANTGISYALATKQQAATVKAQGQLGLAQEGQLAAQTAASQALSQANTKNLLLIGGLGIAAIVALHFLG